MRANLDGSQVETLVETGRGDKDRHDQTDGASESPSIPKLGKIYWTQKGAGQRRAWAVSSAPGSTSPRARRPANRTDIEVLFDSLPEPIDLELDLEQPRPLLDRPRRSPARQHRQSRADRREAGKRCRRS